MDTVKMKRRLRARDGDRCHYCGNVMRFDGKNAHVSATIEHLTRKADGGSNDARNLVLACMACNGIKGLLDGGSLPRYMPRPRFIQSLRAKKLDSIADLLMV